MQERLVRSVQQVLANVESHAEAVVDARGAARFKGTAPEPRKGIRGGHIPGSLNVPFDSLLTDGRYTSAFKNGVCIIFFGPEALDVPLR